MDHEKNEVRYIQTKRRQRIIKAVSYTHLDVYKRQELCCIHPLDVSAFLL